MEVWQQWKIAQQTSGRLSQVHHPNHKWVKPAAGFRKRNVNASILAQRRAMRVGFVMRNNERLVELWKVSGSFSPTIAKVSGLKGVLEFLIFKDFSKKVEVVFVQTLSRPTLEISNQLYGD
ncbi:hypothetical protein NC651_018212 [Populus alba x Populus x berolinensis]|nr:hypothetical protein NC651_018212 [Populus alba x Populus x berolinensis]